MYELVDGEPTPLPTADELHGVVCALVAHVLGRYVFQRGKGYACCNHTGLLVAREPDTVRGPDLMLFDELRRLEGLSRKFATALPRLVVEILSPSDQFSKINRRISQYLKRGVPLVWLVDPEVRSITVYRPGKDLYTVEETDELTGDEVLPDFRCRVAEFFALPGEAAQDQPKPVEKP